MKSTILSSAVLALMGASAASMATPLLSENFDAVSATLAATSAGAFSAVGGTNFDVVGVADGYGYLCAAPAAGNCIDLNGSGGAPQSQVQSNMLFGVGTYLLSYDLIGSGRGQSDSAKVSFGDYNRDYTLASGDVTSGIVSNAPVTLTKAGYLTFASETPGNVGLLLDNVTVASAVPEPGTLALLGLGLAGFGFIRRPKASFRRATI